MTARAGTVFRGVLIVAIFAILLWVVASAKTGRPPASAPRASAEPQSGALLIPVAGVRAAQLSDTFTQARGRGRPHDAIDIMAPRGTAVIAAAEGTVEKLFFSNGGGGITVYVRSPDRRWIYYYAHLDGYAPGLAEGQHVRRGDPIGRVGSTGNASPTAPHLHFAVHAMGAAERWWQGRAVNPYSLLAGRR
jgi:murein DD-endopeptidase MepM/ murein hydrolase activator NlpD